MIDKGVYFCSNVKLQPTISEVEKEDKIISSDYDFLIKKMVELGVLKEKVSISSYEEAEPFLLGLLEEFKNSSDLGNGEKRAIFILAFREYLGRNIDL